METIDEEFKEWAKTYLNLFFKSPKDDSVMDLDGGHEGLTKQDLQIFIDELFTREEKKHATGICIVENKLDDDCIKELCRLEWLKVLEVPANDLSEKSLYEISQRLPNLKKLVISGNYKITNLNQLQNLSQLETLGASHLPLKMTTDDFISLVRKTKLRDLVVYGSTVSEETLQRVKEEFLKNRQGDDFYIDMDRFLRNDM